MINTLKQNATKVALSASALAAAVNPAFAQGSNVPIDPPKGFFGSIGELLNKLLAFVFVIAALLVFLYLILGAFNWITSGGDKGKTENARNMITGAIIGIIVLAAAWAVLQIVLNFLGYGDLNELINTVGTN